MLQVVLDSQPWLQEPSLVELPWKKSITLPKSLKIGVMWHDGLVEPHPPIIRCLQQSVSALKASGHNIVSWDPSLHRDLIACIDKAYFLDGGAEYTDILAAGNEPATPLMKWLLEKDNPKAHSAAESWKLNALRNTLQTAYAAQWNAAGIDAILCPANASVASAHGESTYWGYSSVFNILDYSAAVFPVGAVEETDTRSSYPRSCKEPLSEEDSKFEAYYEAGPGKYKDAPVCLQLVTRRYREEILLDMVEQVVEDIGAGER